MKKELDLIQVNIYSHDEDGDENAAAAQWTEFCKPVWEPPTLSTTSVVGNC